jgi:hypothetical protein
MTISAMSASRSVRFNGPVNKVTTLGIDLAKSARAVSQ